MPKVNSTVERRRAHREAISAYQPQPQRSQATDDVAPAHPSPTLRRSARTLATVRHAEPVQRRRRTTFSYGQLSELEGAFAGCQQPDGHVIAQLALTTSLTETCVRKWFRNRRFLGNKQQNVAVAGPAAAPAANPTRRPRTVFSESQLRRLEQAYEKEPYPSDYRVAKLLRKTCLPETTIKVWFSNRRARTRKEQRAPSPDVTAPEVQQRRTRTVFSAQQLQCLGEVFEERLYPDASIIADLASRTHLTIKQVKVWFNNRRAKHRKQQVVAPASTFEDYMARMSRNIEEMNQVLQRIDEDVDLSE